MGLSSPKACFSLAWAAASRAGEMTCAVGSPGTMRKRMKRIVATAKIVNSIYKTLRMIYTCTGSSPPPLPPVLPFPFTEQVGWGWICNYAFLG